MKNERLLSVCLIGFLASCATVDTSEFYGEKIDATPATGYWSGFYNCSQGQTAFDLTLEGFPDGNVHGEFYFYPTSSNPTTPSGKFLLIGSYHDNMTLILEGDRWIEKPFGYMMVDIEGKLKRPYQSFSGYVSGSGCSVFYVEKVR